MTWKRTIGLVLAGYVAAFVVALIGATISTTRWPPEEANWGMAAFAALMAFFELFCLLALVPTAIAFWQVRRLRSIWTLLAVAALCVAAIAPVTAVVQRLGDGIVGLHPRVMITAANPATQALAAADIFSMLIQLVLIFSVAASPVLALGFLGFALIAPTRRTRIMMATAGVAEGATAAYAVLCLIVLQRWLV